MAVDRAARHHGERTETALVEAMLAGDEQAMEEFADGYFPGLYRFALARLRGDAELSREMVQTTVCKALEKLASYRGEAPLFSWLCACCRNEIAMHFRSKSYRPRLVELDEAAAEPALANPHRSEAPEGVVARREESRFVHAALDQLPPHYARALEWKYLDSLSVNEIAARLRLSSKAAESLLSRARRAFRQGYEHLTGGRGSGGPVVERGMEP